MRQVIQRQISCPCHKTKLTRNSVSSFFSRPITKVISFPFLLSPWPLNPLRKPCGSTREKHILNPTKHFTIFNVHWRILFSSKTIYDGFRAYETTVEFRSGTPLSVFFTLSYLQEIASVDFFYLTFAGILFDATNTTVSTNSYFFVVLMHCEFL